MDARVPKVEIGALTTEHLTELDKPRHVSPVAKIRDSHHRVARLVASGLRNKEIADRTGYSQNRLWILINDPAMQELIARYRMKVDEAFQKSADEYADLAISNMMKAERLIGDRLDEQDEAEAAPMPIKDLVSISRDAADRFGYGKRSTNVNLNADFAKTLEAAISRSGVDPSTLSVEDLSGQKRRF